MGYTQYLRNQQAIPQEQWEVLQGCAVKLFQHAKDHGVALADGAGESGTTPDIDEGYIAFNGLESEGYETCYIDQEPEDFNFCKTDNRPYDVYVVALFKLVDLLGLASFDSDGEDAETEEGCTLAETILKEQIALSSEDLNRKVKEATEILAAALNYHCNVQGVEELTLKTEHGLLTFKQT